MARNWTGPSRWGARRRMRRRRFLAWAAAAALPAAKRAFGSGAPARTARYRVAVIGHTGRGDYGHHIDTIWLRIPATKIVAVADADPRGRAAAVRRLGAPKGYADYRRMLDEEKPDLVAVGPRWIDQHHDMVVAAAERGARGILLEKPLCRTLAEADAMLAACRRHGVKAAIAHQTRYSPKLPAIRELIRSGAIGTILEFRGRGKEDHRGGGEDLWVLGTHVLDLVHLFGGAPRWCFGRVLQDGRPIRKQDVGPGHEGIGPLAGDEVHAIYGLAGGAPAHFDSVRDARATPSRFGLSIFGTRGVIELHTGYLPPVHYLPDPSWSPGRTGKKWIPVSSAGPGKPEPLEDGGLLAGNALVAKDLIAAIEGDREPLSGLAEGRVATEMIVAVFASQRAGGPVRIPLENRRNPLAMLG